MSKAVFLEFAVTGNKNNPIDKFFGYFFSFFFIGTFFKKCWCSMELCVIRLTHVSTRIYVLRIAKVVSPAKISLLNFR